MNRDADLPSRPDEVRLSLVWEIVVPTVVFAAPALLFRLLGLFSRAVNGPGPAPPGILGAIGVVMALGIVAMALVLLVRYESLASRLRALVDAPPAWRRWALLVSMAFLLLTSILANVAAAFEGAGMLLVAAVPTFLASLASRWVAFAGLADRPDD